MLSCTEDIPEIAVESLSFAYPGQPPTLQDFSLTVKAGERVGIIGHNGCGKTTLFLLLSGVLKPTNGSIYLFGEPMQPRQFRPEVGLLFQDPNDQLFSASVWEDIAFGPKIWVYHPQKWIIELPKPQR